MTLAAYDFAVFDASGDQLVPSSGVKIKIVTLQNHVTQKAVAWSIEDSGTSRSCQLTNGDTDARFGAGVVMAEHDSYVGAGITPMGGSTSYILDDTLTLVQSKTFDAGKCALAFYQIVEE